MPICHKCGKASKNVRLCPSCGTAYRPQDLPSRSSGGLLAGGDVMGALRNAPPAVTWGVFAVLALVAVTFYMRNREPDIPVGVVVADIVRRSMSPAEAEALLRLTGETAKVDTSGSDIVVSFASANWPERRAGQLALAQRYARAVEMVHGAKRNIAFHDPDGVLYAKADAAGVVLVK